MIFVKDKYINKLSDTTLLAIRVLVACTLGLLIGYVVFSLSGEQHFRDRIYWIVIAVVSVAASTSTSVVYKRAKSIVVFSLLGTAIGSMTLMLIQKYIDGYFTLLAILCGIALAFYIYTLFLNYATSVFFIHIYLVMYFGLFVGWSLDLFIIRVVSVTIGTVCIVMVTFISRGKKYRTQFIKEVYINYIEFKKIVDDVDTHILNKRIIALVEKNIKLNETLVNARYEFYSKDKYNEYRKIVVLMDELLINLKTYRTLFVQQKKHGNELYKELVDYTNKQINKNFKKLTVRYDRIILQS
ncbi:FUSC family protein [Francisella sp. Scap27]|uniref:FUSC family protein n=1 Tax=Francisella sp. Scap27 TaxID=2589986 RepID=UPI0015B7C00A|nr:FUSC family protein [Francisella sp. Scap27]QLE79939.1 FUSC family protein [Francisella sp. Scap27]